MSAKTPSVESLIAPYVGKTGGLISALRAVQSAYGYLPEETRDEAAFAFNLSRAEVRGVISFYGDFHESPRGRTVVRVCAAEACQATGARALQSAVQKKYGVGDGETTASGDVTVEPVFCLGLCSCAPAALVGDKLIGRADIEAIDAEVVRREKARAR